MRPSLLRTLPVEKVIGTIRQHIPLEQTTVASNSPYYRELKQYNRPTVFFIDMPDMTQSIVYSYVKGDPVDDKASRHASRLFSVYFGGDMSSLMFQEIREFRSFAYRTSGRYQLPNHAHKGTAGSFTAMLSTQSDKTLDALGVLDSLIRKAVETGKGRSDPNSRWPTVSITIIRLSVAFPRKWRVREWKVSTVIRQKNFYGISQRWIWRIFPVFIKSRSVAVRSFT